MNSPERNAEIDRHFAAALELAAPERQAYIAALRSRQPELAIAVERLLAAAHEPDPLLDPERWAGRLAPALAPPYEPARPGERVGVYRVVREIGRGGMSVVYLAERDDGLFEQRVALKFLRVAHEAGLRRLERERRIQAGLSHPNIARLLDGGTDERGRPYIVMEYVEGTPLDAYCTTRSASLHERLRLVEIVATTLEYAHRHLVVHRDIKPSNILVTDDGHVKLLDFGIAKLLVPDEPGEAAGDEGRAADAAALTATMVRVLTPEYASPEQVRGERITTASDVYQLGVLLYELLTGRRPFTFAHASAAEVERVISHGEPQPPSRAAAAGAHGGGQGGAASAGAADGGALLPRLDNDVDTIVLKALAKEPEHRYASVGELRDDLVRFRSGLPVRARRATRRYRARKFVSRHRAGVAAAGVILLSLMAGLGATAWQAVVASRERDRAERARMHAERVSEFLVEIFEVSDPERARAEDVSARELLDRGAARVDQDLHDPGLAATLMGVIGSAYRGLGLYDAAGPLLETALDLRAGAADESALATGLNQLGRLRVDQRRIEEADSLYHAALAIRRRIHGPAHVDIAETLGNLAELRLIERDLDASEEFAREALAMRQRLAGDDDLAVAAARTALGRVHLFRRDYDAAAEQFAHAIARQRALLARPHRDLATALNHLGQVRHNQGRYDEARDLYGEAHSILVHVLGPDHPQTADTYNNLGALLYTKGSIDEAVAIFEEVLASRRRSLPGDHPLLAHTLHNLATLHRAQGRITEAEAGLVQALEIRRAKYGENHPDALASRWTLANLRRDQRRFDESESLVRTVVAAFREAAPSPAHLANALLDHGRVLLALRRAGEAEPLIAEGLARLEEIHVNGHERIDDAKRMLEQARAEASAARSPRDR